MRFPLAGRFLVRTLSLLVAALLIISPGAHASEPAAEKSSVHFYVTGTGLLLMAGGGAFAYYQNREADQAMALYRQSAFTDHTVPARKKVEDHERLTWLGLAGFALGGLLVVVSF